MGFLVIRKEIMAVESMVVLVHGAEEQIDLDVGHLLITEAIGIVNSVEEKAVLRDIWLNIER
jgi:hypothetical protein